MKTFLITGMSGTGKSAVIDDLVARGYRAVDLDTAEWSEWIDADPSDRLTPDEGRDWVWRESSVRELLSTQESAALFVSGTAQNMAAFRPLIDVTILLIAPVATLHQRLSARQPGHYGHSPEDREKVTALVATVEPLLRAAADFVIDTRRSVRSTVDEVFGSHNSSGEHRSKRRAWQRP